MKNVALITGASSGIGKEFARIHAERGGDLVIVAGVTFSQRLMMASIPFLPRRMMLRQVRQMQEVGA